MCKLSEDRNIVLIGFMGAGKSTVARELGRMAGLKLVDLDAEIVRRQGRTIPEIFEGEGEGAFRDYESEALASLEGLRGSVVATGGGIVGRPKNWTLMRRLGPVIYLNATWETLQRRLSGSRGRPLADPRGEMARVRELLEERRPLYEQADFVVKTDLEDAPGVARRILQVLDSGENHC